MSQIIGVISKRPVDGLEGYAKQMVRPHSVLMPLGVLPHCPVTRPNPIMSRNWACSQFTDADNFSADCESCSCPASIAVDVGTVTAPGLLSCAPRPYHNNTTVVSVSSPERSYD